MEENLKKIEEKGNGAENRPPDRNLNKSYAVALQNGVVDGGEKKMERKRAVMRNGIPVVTFTVDEVRKSTLPLKFALIGVFGGFRPNIDDIRRIINCDWGLSAQVEISIIDQKHILMRFSREQDFMKVWTKENHVIKGVRFQIMQWSIDFDPSKESTKHACWVQIPKLPANFFQEDYVASIATGIGKYITSDNPTKTMSRAQGARICVEIDLLNDIQKEVVVEWGNNRRVFEVIYENIPQFCRYCCKRGHTENTCKNKVIADKVIFKEQEGGKPSQIERTNHKSKTETTKAWVTRVFHPRGKRLIWKPKRSNPMLVTGNELQITEQQEKESNKKQKQTYTILTSKGKESDTTEKGLETAAQVLCRAKATADQMEGEVEYQHTTPNRQGISKIRHSKSMDGLVEDRIRKEVGDMHNECIANISVSDNDGSNDEVTMSMEDIVEFARKMNNQLSTDEKGKENSEMVTLDRAEEMGTLAITDINEFQMVTCRKKKHYTANPTWQRQTRSAVRRDKSQNKSNDINE